MEGETLSRLLNAPVGETPLPSKREPEPSEPPDETPAPTEEESETPKPQVGKPGLAYGGQSNVKLDSDT